MHSTGTHGEHGLKHEGKRKGRTGRGEGGRERRRDRREGRRREGNGGGKIEVEIVMSS